jgi:hypothetical protein
MSHETYAPRKRQLLKSFDRSVSRVEPVLVARYGEEEAQSLLQESRRKYEELIPQIPFIGDRNPMLIFLLPTSRFLAIYRSFQKHGRTVEEAGRLIYEISQAECDAIPGPVRRLMAALWFSPWFRGRIRRRAEWSLGRRYPGGYMLVYVEGDGQDFDYGVDYRECASVKLLEEQGAPELGPYVCAVDRVTSEMLGWGLRRTTTLAGGDERCDFRFKKGGETCVPLPQ